MTVKKYKLNIFLEVHTLLKETARFVSKGTEDDRGVCRGPAHTERSTLAVVRRTRWRSGHKAE